MSDPLDVADLGTIRGGQMWEQPSFPCFRCYITLLGDGTMARLSDPAEMGSMVVSEQDGRWQYRPEELEGLLCRLGYVNRGPWCRLADVNRWYRATPTTGVAP